MPVGTTTSSRSAPQARPPSFDLAGRSQTLAGLALGAGANGANQRIGNSSTTADSTLTFAGGSGSASTYGGVLQDGLGNGGTRLLSLVVASGAFVLAGNEEHTPAQRR